MRDENYCDGEFQVPRVPKGSLGGIILDFRMPSDNLEESVDPSL